MTRSQFLKGCASGLCSCAGVAAAEPSDGKVEACRVRFAKLVGILNQNLEPSVRKKIFETLGQECARQYHDLIDKYTGDVKGFLAMGQTQWMEKVEYDEKAGTIRVVDKGPNCSCPLVKPGMTPPEFCDCTLGWQKEAYSTMLKRPVEVELEESILRGGRRCVFRIRC